MNLADARSSHDQVLFDRLAVDADYQPAGGGAAQTVRVIVTPNARRVGEGGYLEVRSEIQVRGSDVAQPAKGDRCQVGSEVWRVDRWEPKGGRWILVVRRV